MCMKVNFVNLGCPKNLVDSEYLMGSIDNIELSSYHKADCIIINTCSFIDQAKKESINEILKAVNTGKKVFVTGCMVYRYKDILQNEIPEAVFFEDIKSLDAFNIKDIPIRNITTKYYAYLKIAEGCNRKCSFCAIPSIRGFHRSKTMQELIDEAKYLKDKGIKELIIVSQDTLYYNEDNTFKSIVKLLESIDKIGFDFVRIMYLYPNAITDELLDFIDNSNILPYFDIPLQHISDNILKSMRRGYKKTDVYKLLEKIYNMKKHPTLRTSFIVGYPEENTKDFEELLDFIEQKHFHYVGVFKYSHEEGTYAYNLEDKIKEEEKQRRFSEVFNISQDIAYEKNMYYMDKEIDIIIESKDKGRAYFQAPDIDGISIIENPSKKLVGSIVKAKVQGVLGTDLLVSVV